MRDGSGMFGRQDLTSTPLQPPSLDLCEECSIMLDSGWNLPEQLGLLGLQADTTGEP